MSVRMNTRGLSQNKVLQHFCTQQPVLQWGGMSTFNEYKWMQEPQQSAGTKVRANMKETVTRIGFSSSNTEVQLRLELFCL